MDRDRPLVVLLLPRTLEDFAHRALAEDLLRADGVVAVDPPRLPYRRVAAWPEALGVLVAQRQAKRLRKHLPGHAAAVAIFEPAQYLLARGIVALEPDCELWYGPFDHDAAAAGPRLTELHDLAGGRATTHFDAGGEALRERLADALAAGEPR